MDPDPPLPDDPRSAHPSEAQRVAGAAAHMESLLFGEELLPVPLDLFARVRDAVRLDPPPSYERLASPGDFGSARGPALSPARSHGVRRRSLVRGIAAAALVAVGAGLSYVGMGPVAAAAETFAAETLRDAGVPAELGLSGRSPVVDAALLPWAAGWEGTRAPSRDLAALAQVPVAVPGGALTLASLALVLVGSGLGLAWRGLQRRLPGAPRAGGAP